MPRRDKSEAVHAIIVRLPLPVYERLVALADKERRPVSLQALVMLQRGLADENPVR